MTDLVEAARAMVAEAEHRLEYAREILRKAEEVAAAVAGIVNVSSPAEAVIGSGEGSSSPAELDYPSNSPSAKRSRVTDNPPPAIVIANAIELLLKKGRPMSRSQLHEALRERGILIKGADAIKTLGTTLWRAKDQIVSLEGLGYWPKDWPYPEGGYNPFADRAPGDVSELL